jgi:hypothetical protein
VGGPAPATAAEERVSRAIVAVVAAVLVSASAANAGAPTIRATPSKPNPLFGDSFTYVVEVAVDAASADSTRIVDDVQPFTRVEPTRVTRRTASGVAHITVTETIACLSAPCIAARGAVVLPPARVTTARGGAAAPSVVIHVGSRVKAAAVKDSKPVFRRPSALPAATTRVDPAAAEIGLALVGILLAGFGAFVLTAPLRRSRSVALRHERVDPVARAIRLLRESATRDSTDRRRAANLASRVVGEPELAGGAARIAWSRDDPGAPDAETLADRVERQSGKGGA